MFAQAGRAVLASPRMSGNRPAMMDRLLIATIAILVWGAFATWVCSQLGAGQLLRIAAVGIGSGAIIGAAALYPRPAR